MTTVALMMVKDEADIVAATVTHLLAHVDEVRVYDNLSTDGTREILEQMPVTLRTDGDPAYYQADKMSLWADECRRDGHEWVVPVDADEIWTVLPHSPGPADGRYTIAASLAALPDWVDVSIGWLYDHVATNVDRRAEPDPVARMVWRQRRRGELPKVACRLKPGLVIHQGNHGCSHQNVGVRVEGQLEIRHFPYRSFEQMLSKARNGSAAYKATTLDAGTGWHWRQMGAVLEREGPDGIRRMWSRERIEIEPGMNRSLTRDPARTGVAPRDPRVPPKSRYNAAQEA